MSDIAKAVVSLPFEPVLGGIGFRIFYVIISIGVIAYAAVAVVQNSLGKWTEPVTELTTSYASQLTYPDLYVCLPGKYTYNYRSAAGRKMYLGSSYFEDANKPKVKSSCEGLSPPIKIDPSASVLAGDATKYSAETCPYKQAAISSGTTISVDAKFGCSGSDGCSDDQISPSDSSPMSTRIKKLTEALRTFTIDGTDYPPLCMGFESKGLTQNRSEYGQFKVLMSIYIDPVDVENPHFEAYLTEPGVDPVDATGTINASQILFSGFGAVCLAELELEQVKDETKGDTVFKNFYKGGTWTKAMMKSDGTTDFKSAHVGLYFASFVVHKIVIRNVTVAEIYSDLGGIWAASLAILAYLFAKSGHIDKSTRKEAYIFKFLPRSVRNAYINEGTAKGEASILPSNKL
ncbi:hypothetical protein AB1Y20_015623 [Prymnesium parvum]|uniref:Uncharacterized protein n=1 Tax=Prymnesium parvum TaxID=97485 RepID=A0AB34K125_PRYPA|mmetsp:Transcript_26956/g.66745  ORF Transcript_26956/g.66745 Transcript_26956/m.66745 type:complete len:403 (-) Transcript_26956:942-2150(-)